ncbi:hypothetical protein G647_04600 [Cladophialophora carrionii CBS 160.54]|uniref:Protein artemis n=1 Tax=Cladophialophora carrionii CBS 160.54 TaxID=1279043 RepID=V9DGY7_9EURO|nr:uncharacterized protein G647_04600 [Cladophialophora carrionii CBS 160.54]ETI25227.1 hypothetical protein G647_04600 [Cladophialophora carrionii CBS 160.54]
MSTFDGLVKEFPTIRIDYFRNHPGRPPPAALFLSHVHSDHLMGLESVKMPFVYCSATTKRILLKMEKYPHRINFAKGILEARKQQYKHLKNILRAVPLNTATEIELGPRSVIRVTLLDANHCPGAVMFLVEGDGRAIVYTGDVRAEPWWVNSIVQNPVLLPYACGLKRLDCIYLDTTFATHDEPYKEFPTKAQGLQELLEKVAQYPQDTIFYFRAWTLGYEAVWVALSNFLQSQIHVNDYQLGIFRDGNDTESAALTGFTLGNSRLQGCLTDDKTARIHSCEPGLDCHSQIKNTRSVVWISPIISRLKDGSEVRELGAGGGWRDLYPKAQLKLEESANIVQLLTLCASYADSEEIRSKLAQALSRPRVGCDLSMILDEAEEVKVEDDDSIKLGDFVTLVSKKFNEMNTSIFRNAPSEKHPKPVAQNDTIHFPYSRHSSYNELRHLVGVFRPRDICPCTVSLEAWSEDLSMESLFGDLCQEQVFYYDQETRNAVAALQGHNGVSNGVRGKRRRNDDDDDDSQRTQSQNGGCYEPSSPVVFTSPIKASSPEDTKSPSKLFEEENIVTPRDHRLGKIENAGWQHHTILDGNTSFDGFDSQPLSSSAFDSQPDQPLDSSMGVHVHNGLRDQEPQATHEVLTLCGHRSSHLRIENSQRKQARIDAYFAARHAILHNDVSEWDSVPLRSVGHPGHDEEELEL